MKKLFTSLSILLFANVLFIGCAYNPYNHQVIDSYDDPIMYAVMVTAPNSLIEVKAFNKKTKKWMTVDLFTSSSTLTYEAGSMGTDNPDLYGADGDLYLDHKCIWTKNCSTPVYGRKYSAKIKSVLHMNDGSKFDLITFDEDGGQCIQNSEEDSFNQAIWNCRSEDYPVVNIHTEIH